MPRKRLLWQIFPAYFIVTLLALSAIVWYSALTYRNVLEDGIDDDLTARAQLIEQQILAHIRAGDYAQIDATTKHLGRITRTRITVILRDGTVIGDTDRDPARIENHEDRPEIIRALSGDVGRATRFSDTVRMPMRYAALPVHYNGEVSMVIRTAIPLTRIQETLRTVYAQITLGGILIALLAALISWMVSRRVTRPLAEMRDSAEKMAEGDLKARLPIYDSEEIAVLAETMNQMARQMDERIRLINQQRREQEIVFANMQEGVLAVDRDERILNLNDAAARYLRVERPATIGKTVQEVVRITRLQEILKQTLGGERVEGDFTVEGNGQPRQLRAIGSGLQNADGDRIGALVVLHDVTRLRRLENLRREFVANVSHELKTPITSIKGFVETLQSGALDDRGEAQRFLGIVAKHCDRLQAIIEDLLSLSRIEQETEREMVELEPGRFRPVLAAAIQICQIKAEAKRIPLELDCPEDLEANINKALLEQAIVNLIDNAVKYSEPESPVRVSARAESLGFAIEVADKGCGIPNEHLPRLFERFYRVDKARSRQLGGTGLGLAIAKHIAQAHGGTIDVESAVGAGSTFRIWIPRQPRTPA